MEITDTTTINAAIDRVWQLTLDVESWPEHTPTMASVEKLDSSPLEVGSRARVKQPGQRSRVWTVTRLEPGEIFAWQTRAFGATMTGSHLIAAHGTGTMQTLRIDIEGALSPVVGAILRRSIRKAICTENQGFKAAAEQGGS